MGFGVGDHRKLRVFGSADRLAKEVYRVTASFPAQERYGLTSQLRRAAVSVPTNLVEGCGRSGLRDGARFFDIATGSVREVAYLLELSRDLGFIEPERCVPLLALAKQVSGGLVRLVRYRTQGS